MLDDLAVPLMPAEAHGMLCGLLCSQPAGAAKTRWFSELLDAAGLQAESLAAQAGNLRVLDHWFTRCVTALDDPELDFEPLLPDDEATLKSRSQALADFCAGFTYGIGIGIGIAVRGSRPLPADTAELVKDFQTIESSVADAADRNTDADDEAAFVELVEYVRVGVLLVHEELRPVVEISGTAGASERGADPSSDVQVH